MIVSKANRLKDVGEYYFSKKLEEVRKLRAQGADVINLGIGSPDLIPSENTLEATIKSLKGLASHGYGPSRGTLELRAAMAQWYKRVYGVTLNPNENILPLLGSKEGIMFISLAFLNPGDGVLVPDPGYPPYSNVTKLVGAREVKYNLKEENNWLPNFSELESLDLNGVKLMWVNYPNMPTGTQANGKTFERLIEFGHKKKILICNDNPYSLVLNPNPTSLLRYDPKFEVSLELNSLSKAFNMPGWRVGMVCSNPPIIDSILQVKSNVDSGMFLPVQAGAIAAFENSDEWHKERNQEYEKRRHFVFKIFDELGFKYSIDQVGLFVWAKAPEKIKNLPEYLDKILLEAHIFITPGFIFGPNGERFARSSLCAPVKTLEEAYSRIKKWRERSS